MTILTSLFLLLLREIFLKIFLYKILNTSIKKTLKFITNCHTKTHGSNFMQNEVVHLVLFPREALRNKF